MMNKTFRILLVVILLAWIIVIAGSKSAWATPAAKQPEAAPASVNGAPAAAAPIGSVRALNCDGIRVLDEQIESVCGVAILTGTLGTDVFASLEPIPGGFYSQAVRLFFTSGNVQICFAAPTGGTLFFLPIDVTEPWTIVPTNVVDGFACATVAASGSYALGPVPTPTPAP